MWLNKTLETGALRKPSSDMSMKSKTIHSIAGLSLPLTTVLPMDFRPGQVLYGFNVTKEIDSKTFFGVKGFITRLVLPVVDGALASLTLPRALGRARCIEQ